VPWRRFAAMSWLRYSKVVSGWQVPPNQFGIDERGTPSCSSFLTASLLKRHRAIWCQLSVDIAVCSK
jgi:hypothetical protein